MLRRNGCRKNFCKRTAAGRRRIAPGRRVDAGQAVMLMVPPMRCPLVLTVGAGFLIADAALLFLSLSWAFSA